MLVMRMSNLDVFLLSLALIALSQSPTSLLTKIIVAIAGGWLLGAAFVRFFFDGGFGE